MIIIIIANIIVFNFINDDIECRCVKLLYLLALYLDWAPMIVMNGKAFMLLQYTIIYL